MLSACQLLYSFGFLAFCCSLAYQTTTARLLAKFHPFISLFPDARLYCGTSSLLSYKISSSVHPMVETGVVSAFKPTRISYELLTRFSPLELRPRRKLAGWSLGYCFLRHRLGSYSVHIWSSVQITQLDSPRLRMWSWCTSMGPNMVGRFRNGPVSTLGW